MRIFALCLLAGLILTASCSGTDNSVVLTGLVDATEIDVASKIPGRIKEMLVREGDRVAKDQPLVTITSDEIDAKLSQVNAAIDAANSQLAMARKGARSQEKRAVRKQVDAARHQVEITEKMYNRLKPLAEQKAIPQSKFDEVEFKYNVSKDQLAMAEAKLSMVMEGARKEQIEALESLVKKAQGVQAEVESYQRETSQSAPIAGEVAKVILHPGELAATGYPIVTLVDLSDQWAVFAVREDRLKEVRVGTKLPVEIPALGMHTTMEVFNIAAMGDFATWKATTNKNSFDLKSFEVKARPVKAIDGLRPGMTVRWRTAAQ